MASKTKWLIDQDRSEIAFKVRHLMISNVKGVFQKFDANIYTVDNDFMTAEVDMWIEAASITTGDDEPDEHLKSVDFFDVEHYKQILFTLNKIGRSDAMGNHELWGSLSIRQITNMIKLNVQFGGVSSDALGRQTAVFTVTGKINRNNWKLIWHIPMETAGLVVSEEVTVSCRFELFSEREKTLRMEPGVLVSSKEMY